MTGHSPTGVWEGHACQRLAPSSAPLRREAHSPFSIEGLGKGRQGKGGGELAGNDGDENSQVKKVGAEGDEDTKPRKGVFFRKEDLTGGGFVGGGGDNGRHLHFLKSFPPFVSLGLIPSDRR